MTRAEKKRAVETPILSLAAGLVFCGVATGLMIGAAALLAFW